ncbi:aldo/keto reductase [Roseobacter litoralis]|uniref:aldo/keto reductase n=1 Tax=Roseobacter litoralis TaxID=42443 RepID=UPI002494179F|nr:aldo/keto reductase [Roseobacter litoralis]
MHFRQLRQDGKKVSAIGLGCWSFAGSYGPTTETETHSTLSAARDLGVDFLDTANVYGMGVSESVIGSYLKANQNSFTIATKAGISRDPETGARIFNNQAAYLRTELEGSLSRLGLEQVDLYYMHRRDVDIPIEDVMETLLAFKAEGKIGGIGFSEISPASLRRANAVGGVDAVQSEYSLWTRQPEMGMIQTCKTLGVAFVPFSPLGRGVFTPTPPDPATFEKGHFRTGTPRFSEPNFSHNMTFISQFQSLAQALDTSPATLAIAWCLAQGDHLIPIPGTRSAAHLAECVAGCSFEMTQEIKDAIDDILPIGWAHGDRYAPEQWPGVEGYC